MYNRKGVTQSPMAAAMPATTAASAKPSYSVYKTTTNEMNASALPGSQCPGSVHPVICTYSDFETAKSTCNTLPNCAGIFAAEGKSWNPIFKPGMQYALISNLDKNYVYNGITTPETIYKK